MQLTSSPKMRDPQYFRTKMQAATMNATVVPLIAGDSPLFEVAALSAPPEVWAEKKKWAGVGARAKKGAAKMLMWDLEKNRAKCPPPGSVGNAVGNAVGTDAVGEQQVHASPPGHEPWHWQVSHPLMPLAPSR